MKCWWMLLFSKRFSMSCFIVIQHAADERIRLEELRSKVVNITVTWNNYSSLFYAFHSHTVMWCAGSIRRWPWSYLLGLWRGIGTSYLLISISYVLSIWHSWTCFNTNMRHSIFTPQFSFSLSLRLGFNCSRSMLSRFRNGAGSSATVAIRLNHSKSRCLTNIICGVLGSSILFFGVSINLVVHVFWLSFFVF